MKIRIIKSDPKAVLPQRAHLTDVGYDVVATGCEWDESTDTYIYHTGLILETDPDVQATHVIYGFARSSISKKEAYLTNCVGIIDSDGYRGEIQFRYKNRTSLETLIQLETLKRIVTTPHNDSCRYDWYEEGVRKQLTLYAKNLVYAPYRVGDKIGQFVFSTVLSQGTGDTNPIIFEEVDEVSQTERGSGGFGSTDK